MSTDDLGQGGSLADAALAPASQQRITPATMQATPAQFQNAPNTARFPAMPSVTENTTRFFEPHSGPAQTANPVPVRKTER